LLLDKKGHLIPTTKCCTPMLNGAFERAFNNLSNTQIKNPECTYTQSSISLPYFSPLDTVYVNTIDNNHFRAL
jgi:hypothetical protein